MRARHSIRRERQAGEVRSGDLLKSDLWPHYALLACLCRGEEEEEEEEVCLPRIRLIVTQAREERERKRPFVWQIGGKNQHQTEEGGWLLARTDVFQ